MPSASILEWANGRPEMRQSPRCPVVETVRYRLRGASGTGCTIDISNDGIRFSTEQRLEPGQSVELDVDWPVALGGTLLKLVVAGRVVRSERSFAAVTIVRYEFRNRGSGF